MNPEKILSHIGTVGVGLLIGYLWWGTGSVTTTGSDTTSVTVGVPDTTEQVVNTTPQQPTILPNPPVQRRTRPTPTDIANINWQALFNATENQLIDAWRAIDSMRSTAVYDGQTSIGDSTHNVSFNQHLEYSAALKQFAYKYTNAQFTYPQITNTKVVTPPFFSRLHIGTRTSFSFNGGEPSYGAYAAIEIPIDKLSILPEFGHATDRKAHGSISLNFYPFR